MKLLCLPYAGGTAQVFINLLKPWISSSVEIVPVELPGRGTRFAETMKTNFSELLDDVVESVLDIVCDGTEYALLGYSMGSRLIYEIYYRLLNINTNMPQIMFFCAALPPEISCTPKKLDRASIIQEIRLLGGTSEEVLENEQLMDIFVPIMKADLQVLFSYKYVPKNIKMNVPVVVLYGTKDNGATETNMFKWEKYTDKNCEFVKYDDGHFFINKYYKEIAYEIDLCIKKYI